MKAIIAVLAILVLALVGCQDQAVSPVDQDSQQAVASLEKGGFDEFGYNYQARIFNGIYDGADRMFGNLHNGYENDKLVMKWSKAWDDARFNGAPWTPDAWEDNEWNGQVKGGSGEIWHYKIVWVGLQTDGSLWPDGFKFPDGGYAIWEQFEVIMSHGTVANEHFWETHANPSGYGMK